MKDDPTVAVVLGVLFALLVVRWYSEPTVTAYWLSIHGDAWITEEFSVGRSSGTVVVAMRQVGHGKIYFLKKDCAILDRKNWSCADGGYRADDGKVSDQILETDPRVKSVSRSRWWVARIGAWLSGKPPPA